MSLAQALRGSFDGSVDGSVPRDRRFSTVRSPTTNGIVYFGIAEEDLAQQGDDVLITTFRAQFGYPSPVS